MKLLQGKLRGTGVSAFTHAWVSLALPLIHNVAPCDPWQSRRQPPCPFPRRLCPENAIVQLWYRLNSGCGALQLLELRPF